MRSPEQEALAFRSALMSVRWYNWRTFKARRLTAQEFARRREDDAKQLTELELELVEAELRAQGVIAVPMDRE
jgi:anti-sigma regulatory factor (Ser/Thr protein kinase)